MVAAAATVFLALPGVPVLAGEPGGSALPAASVAPDASPAPALEPATAGAPKPHQRTRATKIFPFAWSRPWKPWPGVNRLSAGAGVSVGFSLAGDRGLGILASGSPTVQPYHCRTGRDVPGTRQETVPVGAAGVQYDAATRRYVYAWQTREDWSGTCARFRLALTDGTTHVLRVRFLPFSFVLPTVRPPFAHVVVAGTPVPVYFRTGSSRDRPVVASGWPRSRQVDCTTGAPIGPMTATARSGPRGLAYSHSKRAYRYLWATPASWSGTCRSFVLQLRGLPGQSQVARYRFETAMPNEPPVAGDASFSVAEDATAGTVLGSVAFTDPDAGQGHTLAILSGNGAGAFAIDPATGEIRVANASALDFETLPSVQLVVRVADSGVPALHDDADVTIAVTDANDAPSDIALSGATVVDDAPAGTVIGTLSATDADQPTQDITFAIVGIGTAAVASDTFEIVGTELRTGGGFDAVATGAYAVTIRATDDGTPPRFRDETFTVTVTGSNHAPTDITLTTSSIAEDQPAGSTIGTLGAVDPDGGQTHTFSLAGSGCGGGPFPSNAAFSIVGSALRTAIALDFETTTSYTLCVRAIDSGDPSATYDEALTIAIIDANDPPSFALPADPDQAELEDAGVRTVAGFASSISAGAPGESGQALTFAVTAADPTLFAVGPAIDATGSLTYMPAANRHGTTTVSVTLSDDGGGADTSPTQAFDISITPVNDPPTFSLPAGADQTVPQDSGPQTVAGFATAISAGPVDEAGQALAFAISTTDDALFATLPTMDPATGDLRFASAAAATGSATISVVLEDDGGTANGGDDASATRSFDITVTPDTTNDPPVITLSGTTPSYIENGSAPILDGALTLTDVDDTTLASGTVSIAQGLMAGDSLSFVSVGGITDVDPAAAVLALTGTASVADWQSVLRSVRFSSLNDNPTASTRTVRFVVSDGDAASSPADTLVTVVPVNDPPMLTQTGGGVVTYVENAAPMVISPTITVTDVDSSTLVGATVLFGGGYANGQDVLSLGTDPQNDITAVFDADSGILTLSGTASVADYRAALRDVRYANTSDNPTAATRTIGFIVADGPEPGDSSNVITRAVSITRVNDRPEAVDDAFTGASGTLADTRLAVGTTTTGPHVAVPGSVLSNDSDVDTASGLTAGPALISSTNCAGCDNVALNPDGSFTYDPPAGFTGIDTFTYTVNDHDSRVPANQSDTATVSIEVVGPVV